MKFFWAKSKKESVIDVAKKQLKDNRAVIESLRDYDTGKKNISTSDVKRRLGNIQIAPQK